jgi:hypothetical protein
VAAQTCTGDTNGDGVVQISDLIQCVRQALGTAAATQSCDADTDGMVEINELITAVGNALGTCEIPLPVSSEAVEGSARVAITAVGSLEVLDIGGAAVGSDGGLRLLRLRDPRMALARRPGGSAAGVAIGCVSRCDAEGGSSVLTETFTDCIQTDSETGTELRLNGSRVRTVSAESFCTTNMVPPGATDTTRYTAFRADFTCEDDCPPGLQSAVLEAGDLTVARRPAPAEGELESVLTGDLTVENRLTGERLEQTFGDGGLALTERADPSEQTVIRLDGKVTLADCLEPLQFATTDPIVFSRGAKCPSDGSYDVTLGALAMATAADIEGGAETQGPEADGVTAGALPAGTLRETVYRALDGRVYQVLQNTGAAGTLGVPNLRVTTAVGAAGPSARVALCTDLPADPRSAVQVVAAVASDAFDPAGVVKSELISGAPMPCFNPTANAGAGRVCIGTGCNPDTCACSSSACRTFFIDGGEPLTSDGAIPPARLVDASVVEAPCRVEGRATYAFGETGPTTSVFACGAEPQDGFLLPPASSVVFAYDAPFGSGFVTGSGAIPIARDRVNQLGCDPGEVLGPVQAAGNITLPPPRVSFRAASVQVNLNADEVIDDVIDSCEDARLLYCAPTPAATPTPNSACRTSELRSDLTVSRTGTTTVNLAGGASCGLGGNDAPDFAFGYKAPQAGFYTFDTLGSEFDTILYVRESPADTSCGTRERACNDDRDPGTRQSQLGLSLARGERVVIIVDGFADERGEFTLTVRFVSASSPTPTPSPTPGGAGRPDLIVSGVSGPPAGAPGGTIEVVATVANLGGAAGPFELEFALSPDATIGNNDLTGFGCVFAGLAEAATARCRGDLPLGAQLAPGSYVLGAIVDQPRQVAEVDENNNTGVSGTSIQIGDSVPTFTATATHTVTATVTATHTSPPTPTETPTVATPTGTPPTATATGTVTATPSITTTPDLSATNTAGATATRSATPTRTVRTPTPTRTPTLALRFEPQSVAIQPEGEVVLLLRPIGPRETDTVITVAASTSGVVSIEPNPITIPVGEEFAELLVRGEAEGTTTLVASGAASAAASVYVTQRFSGSGTFVAPLVKVVVPTPVPTPQPASVAGAFVAPLVNLSVAPPGPTAQPAVVEGAVVALLVSLSVPSPVPTPQPASVSGAIVAPLIKLAVPTPLLTSNAGIVPGAIVAPLVSLRVNRTALSNIAQEVVP